MYKIVLFIFIALTFTHCAKNDRISELRIRYMAEHIDFATSLECDEIFEVGLKVVTEKKTLKKLSKIMNELVDTCDNLIDARISCLVVYSDNSSDTLCLGYKWGSRLNGKPICDNEAIFELVRDIIYPDEFLAIYMMKRENGGVVIR